MCTRIANTKTKAKLPPTPAKSSGSNNSGIPKKRSLGFIDVLKPFIREGYQWGLFGGVITVIFISGGTEGFNSLMKWLSYKKKVPKPRPRTPRETRAALLR